MKEKSGDTLNAWLFESGWHFLYFVYLEIIKLELKKDKQCINRKPPQNLTKRKFKFVLILG